MSYSYYKKSKTPRFARNPWVNYGTKKASGKELHWASEKYKEKRRRSKFIEIIDERSPRPEPPAEPIYPHWHDNQVCRIERVLRYPTNGPRECVKRITFPRPDFSWLNACGPFPNTAPDSSLNATSTSTGVGRDSPSNESVDSGIASPTPAVDTRSWGQNTMMWPTSNLDAEDSGNTTNPKAYGVTSAISNAAPKPIDIVLSDELSDIVVGDVEEMNRDINARMTMLCEMDGWVKEWITELSLARNLPAEIASNHGGRVCTFGSFRLGVHSIGADIDALCLAPRHIERSDYFSSFYEKLSRQPQVTDLRAVEEAFVPVIKMKCSGIEVDLLFARLATREIPKKIDLQDDKILKNLDPRCVRSLNGCRVTDEILRCVPNAKVFRLALRAIKLWAKRHNIYSNALGYLGGVSWAMLVARTCQLYPNAAASTVVQKFYMVFSQWNWPCPVLLRPIDNPENLDFPVWDPRINLADRQHLMPIITPSYPQQNSTFNVSASTRTVMCKYLEEGFRIAEEIVMERAKWSLLFERPNFFAEYKHFILLIASSGSEEEQLAWGGLIEAKVRTLITLLEKKKFIKLVHANPEIFKLREDYQPDNENNDKRENSVWAIGIEFDKVENVKIDLTVEIQNFTTTVIKHAVSINLYRESMMVEAKYVKKKLLRTYLEDSILVRDRPASEILKDVAVSNGATILLGKRTADETPTPPVSVRKTILPLQNQYRKVNTKPDANNRSEENKSDENKKTDENDETNQSIEKNQLDDSDDVILVPATPPPPAEPDVVFVRVTPPSPADMEMLSSSGNDSVTSSRQLMSPSEGVFIDLCSSDAEQGSILIDEYDNSFRPPRTKRMRFTIDERTSSPEGRNMSPDSSRQIPTPSPNDDDDIICLDSDSE